LCVYPTWSTNGTYTVTVKNLQNNASDNVTYSINNTTTTQTSLTITTSSPLPNARVGVPYLSSILGTGGEIVGGVYRYAHRYSLSGSLPLGINGSESCDPCSMGISGTPQVAGTYAFSVTMTSGSQSVSKQFTLTVDPAYVNPIDPVRTYPLTITNPSTLPNVTVGSNSFESIGFLGVSGGPSNLNTNNYGWSITSGSLPPGLYLSASDYGEIINGVPTTIGTYRFTLSVNVSTATGSYAGSKDFILTVNPATIISPDSPLTYLTQNGVSTLRLRVGEMVQYEWGSQNVNSPSSVFTVDSPDTCGSIYPGNNTWVANTLYGSSVGTIDACQAGHTYTITYTGTKDGKSHSTQLVQVIR
jgi:hypothetical protein